MPTPEDVTDWEFMYYMETYVEPFAGVFYVMIASLVTAIMNVFNIIMYTVGHFSGTN